MAASKFTEANRAGILELVADGATIKDAARVMDVREKTVRGWLTKGRLERTGPYAEFAAALDAMVDEATEKAAKPMDRKELEEHVALAVRAGSVQAMKLMEEMLRRGDDSEDQKATDPFGELDQETQTQDDLAEARRRKEAGG